MTSFCVAVFLERWAAKNKWLQFSSTSRSFIKIRNGRGPSTEPGGTPLFTIHSLERCPPNFTREVLFFRDSSTQRLILRWIPIATIFLTSRRWHTESKAFEKCEYTISTGSPACQSCLWLFGYNQVGKTQTSRHECMLSLTLDGSRFQILEGVCFSDFLQYFTDDRCTANRSIVCNIVFASCLVDWAGNWRLPLHQNCAGITVEKIQHI